MTEEQINAYRIADNRTAEESEWDNELLKMEIKELEAIDFKLDLLGSNEDQLNDLLFEEKQGLTDEGKVEISKTVQPVAKKISKLMDKKDELTKAAKKRKELKFGGGADMGSKKLSPKQMKIAKLAGNKKKIDAPDFKKLRAMKSPMSQSVRKS